MERNVKNNRMNEGKFAVYAVAGMFAIPLLAAVAVPGTLLTALCFAVPFAGAAYLCGTKMAAEGENCATERMESCAATAR
jgi:hypothetical protein